MASVNWRGKSGKYYTYEVYDFDDFNPADKDGNYIFARDVRGSWHAVYVGQGIARIEPRGVVALDGDDCAFVGKTVSNVSDDVRIDALTVGSGVGNFLF